MINTFTIPLSYTPIDGHALAERLDRYSGRHHGAIVRDFETGLVRATQAPFVVGVNSGTAAIHLALMALGVGKGDRVIVSSFTYVASLTPILYLGAIPILVDCEPLTWNIDPDLVEEAIEESLKTGVRPKAIVVVHTYGMPAQMDRLLAIARHHGIALLEDAAEAIGSSIGGLPLGSLGDTGALSFNSNKALTTYGGGAVLVSTAETAEKVLYWATHARRKMPHYEHEEEGYNYRLGPLNAAMGLVELDLLGANVVSRRNTFSLYAEMLADTAIGWQTEPDGSYSNRWLSCAIVPNGVDRIRKALTAAGIETRPLWKPMHQQPLFKDHKAITNGNSDNLFATGICLPSSNNITPVTIEMVCNQIRKALKS